LAAPASAWASFNFFFRSSTFFFSAWVAVIQFLDVVKTTVEIPRKSSENAMITITRILPTKVMVPSYHSE